MTIDDIVKQMDWIEIWQKHYSALPSYANYKLPDYGEKMRDKYLTTYKLAVEEMKQKCLQL